MENKYNDDDLIDFAAFIIRDGHWETLQEGLRRWKDERKRNKQKAQSK